MEDRKVKTEGFVSLPYRSEAVQSDKDQASLISDLQESIKVNRQLIHKILIDRMSSTNHSLASSSKIPFNVAEAMIKENTIMSQRLKSLKADCQQLGRITEVTQERILQYLKAETLASQTKFKEAYDLEVEGSFKNIEIKRLNDRGKLLQFDVNATKKGLMPSTSKESMKLLVSKSTQIKEFKSKLSLKLRYQHARFDQITSALQCLRSGIESPQSYPNRDELRSQPMENLGYGHF